MNLKPDQLTDKDKELLLKSKKTDSFYMLKDLMSGDESVTLSKLFEDISLDDIKYTLNMINNDITLSEKDKINLLSNAYRINYRIKPPTINEFLTVDWIGETANGLYPHIRQILSEFWKPESKKRHLILASAIRCGKSVCSALSSLYQTTCLWCMRSPKKFFGMTLMSSIVFMMISFTMEKAEQVLLKPFMEILTSSQKFKRVKFEESLEPAQKDNPDKICWTTAGRMGKLEFYNDLHYIIASDPAQLLGLNAISAILSEISFFSEKGFSSEYIWRIYQDCIARVKGTVGDKYYSGTVLDSSPNDISLSPIDKYIFSGEAEKDEENYVFTGPQWKYRSELNPIWLKTGETFPVFRGSETEPARILEVDEVKNYNSEEVFNVPIDQEKLFKLNCLKNVKDICGWPAGAKGMLVRDEKIIDRMFNDNLKNIYTFIRAPENLLPNHLIWNTVYKKFWIEYDKGYEFYRAPNAPRYLHIDQSESGDVAGIAMCHPELDKKSGTTIYIIDFTIPISPDKSRINLDAIRYFIQDLVELGHINLKLVTFDQYQSSSAIQFLNRKEIKCERLSVDSTTAPYYNFIAYMSSGKIKCGKNIILKNNIKSLQETTTRGGHTKIDHILGKTYYEDNADWNMSNMGKNAKDTSDACCISYDTEVFLLSGKKITIEQLYNEGYDNEWVIACDTENKCLMPVQIQEIIKKDIIPEKLIKITLDNDESFSITEDHLVLCKDGIYKEGKDLEINDSLMPFVIKYVTVHRNDYRHVQNPYNNKFSPIYKLVVHSLKEKEFQELELTGNNVYKVIHHINHVKTNDNPDNLRVMGNADHRKLHSEIFTRYNKSEKHKKDVAKAFKDGKYNDWINSEKYKQMVHENGAKAWTRYNKSEKHKNDVKQAFKDGKYDKMPQHSRETSIKRYGVEYPTQLSIVKDKIKKTCIEKYGVENPCQNEKVKDKIKETNLKKYGVENVFQSMEIKEKIKETNLNKYGTEYSCQNEEVKDKIKKICLRLYGVENYTKTKEYAEQSKQTCLERYGTEHFFNSNEYKQINLEKYGVEYSSQADEVKEKVKQTCLERYGTDSYFKSEDYKEKTKTTCLEKYGVEYYSQSEDFKLKSKISNIKKIYDIMVETDSVDEFENFTLEDFKKELKDLKDRGIINKKHNIHVEYDLLIQAGVRLTNHKIINIEIIDNKKPVYDIHLNSIHNFAISAGVFVHNCGCIWNCIQKFSGVPSDIWDEDLMSRAAKELQINKKIQFLKVLSDKYGFKTEDL